mmetsp:Transcript_134717/g.190478  ORF Transcript_134717/g.190478 Transcript_134717/m.190478 type:complete len:299 (+) Transcript_134717:103-999(+)
MIPQNPGYLSRPGLSRKAARQRLDVLSVFQCLFLPWLFFCAIFALLSCSLHFYRPTLTYILVALGGLLLAGLCWTSLRLVKSLQEPSWYTFLFATMVVAWLLGVTFGNMNFAATTSPYHSYLNMDVLPEVSVEKSTGEEVMPAGRAFFGTNSLLDIRRSMAFKNVDTYCVAPISIARGVIQPLENYDFWAIGLNCCSLNTADFHCGEYQNPHAHSGLRLLNDEQRSFYRLAVEQAEAAYSIKAEHPLFFYWTEDATAEMDSFQQNGYKYFLIGMLGHFAFQTVCVLVAIAAFSNWDFA